MTGSGVYCGSARRRGNRMARFRVRDTFIIESRRWFVVAGSIVEGVVRAGMIVKLPDGGASPLLERVQSIEFARRTDGQEDVCLCISYDDAEKLAVLTGLH